MMQSCHCCCCFRMPLDKASRIIGITWAILATISVFRGCVALMTAPTSGTFGNAFDNSEAVAEEARTILLVQICSSAIWAISGVMLAIGVYRESPCLVIAFLVVSCLGLTLSTMVTLYAFCDPSGFIGERELEKLREQHGPADTRNIVLALIITTLAITGFCWYLWMVVFSYYTQLTSDRQQQQQQQFQQIPKV